MLIFLLPHCPHCLRMSREKNARAHIHTHNDMDLYTYRQHLSCKKFISMGFVYVPSIIFTHCTQNEQIIRINFALKTFSSAFFLSFPHRACRANVWTFRWLDTQTHTYLHEDENVKKEVKEQTESHITEGVFTFIYGRYVLRATRY